MIHRLEATEEVAEKEQELVHDVLDAAAELARDNRRRLDAHRITAIDVMGAIGSGKTTLIGLLAAKLGPQRRIAVINGDPTTATDVEPIAALGVPVVQIAAHACHLDAGLVARGLGMLDLDHLDLILIENVGNLICPAEFPLGAKARLVVVSVTEGPWMVRKHPHMFRGADLVVINKLDLAPVMTVDVDALIADVHALKPDLPVRMTSCRTGAGLADVAAALLEFEGPVHA